MKTKIYSLIVVVFALLLLMPGNYVYASTAEIKISDVKASEGATVEVPIVLSGNTGICGANIIVTYDKELCLTDISAGYALPSLTMTKPGDMTSNPFSVVWDGMEEDTTNGTIAVLTFKAPTNAGKYNVNITCDDTDIVDGNLKPVAVILKSGSIIVEKSDSVNDTQLVVDSVTSNPGTSLVVPVRVTGNSGICGATLTINYDPSLILTNITKGDGVGDLNMTKPGSYSSGPFVLVWDGLEEDISNGVIAYLTFTAPKSEGEFDVTVSFGEGDIVDGNLNPVSVNLVQGKVTITKDKFIGINLDGASYYIATKEKNVEGKVLISFYDETDKLVLLKMFNDTDYIEATSPKNSSLIKIMWWNDIGKLKPVSKAKMISKNGGNPF